MRLFLALVLFLLPSICWAHDPNHSEFDEWYQGLHKPHPSIGFGIGTTSCCAKIHCHETRAEIRWGGWWARIGKPLGDGQWELRDWIKVPPDAVLTGQTNPTGEGVICHDIVWKANTNDLDLDHTVVFCFVPPSES